VSATNKQCALLTIQRPEAPTEAGEHIAAAPCENAADLRLAARIDQAMRASGYLELRELQFCVDHVCVTLSGCVRSFHLKQLAQDTVISVPGTQFPENQIVVVRR
jgi:osmotically-inducible protein OsmY